jgi:2-polyprenyl-3-methyl-5-hydroxy-6-metoxy-1,4-benzoquinol methylase
MNDLLVSKYYDEQYYIRNHSDRWIKLPFGKQGYYGAPLQRLGCKAGDKLLDVACGQGQLLERAEAVGLQCWGIDISQVATDRARVRSRETSYAQMSTVGYHMTKSFSTRLPAWAVSNILRDSLMF